MGTFLLGLFLHGKNIPMFWPSFLWCSYDIPMFFLSMKDTYVGLYSV